MIYWLCEAMDEMLLGDEGISPSFLSEHERVIYQGLRMPRRRREWLLGRRTAKRLLRRSMVAYTNCPLTEITVANDPDGAPYYCVGGRRLPLSLSLSHRAGRAVCALSNTHTVGVDIERVERREPAFVEDFFTASENALVQAVAEADRDRLVTLIWSVKEAALKVLREGLRSDTRSIEVSGPVAPEYTIHNAQHFPWSPLHICCLGDKTPRLAAWWQPDGDDVLTLAAALFSADDRPEICAV